MWNLLLPTALVLAFSRAQIRHGDVICVMSDSNSCLVDDLTPSELDGSTVIYPGGTTRCAYDDFASDHVSFRTNATYFFQVFPAPEQSKAKLLLYFQSGGACIDDLTCAFGLQCMYETFTANARPLSTGILNRSNDKNLFNDYNIVHLPYCTGDLHIGSHVTTIPDSPLYALLNKPACQGHNMTLHQVGYRNTKAVLDWAVENYPDPDEIIISGSSAGALAAQALSALVADVCELDLRVTSKLWDQCGDDNELTVAEMMSFMIKDVPTAQWLFLISGESFYSNMTAIIDVYKNLSNEVSTFYVNSTQHVFLTEHDYYHNAIRSPTGMRLGDFLKKWLVTNSSLDVNVTDGSLSASGSVAESKESAAVGLDSALLLTVVAVFIFLFFL